jgi:hypothetical protein
MARQILKRLTLVMSMMGMALASAVVANGQARANLSAQVPFDFIVASKDFRAGEYNVRAVTSAGEAILISTTDKKDRVVTLTNGTGPNNGEDLPAKLVFHRYGNTYFLSQIWMAGEMTGHQLPESRRERAAERELKTLASNRDSRTARYEVVEVLAMVR